MVLCFWNRPTSTLRRQRLAPEQRTGTSRIWEPRPLLDWGSVAVGTPAPTIRVWETECGSWPLDSACCDHLRSRRDARSHVQSSNVVLQRTEVSASLGPWTFFKPQQQRDGSVTRMRTAEAAGVERASCWRHRIPTRQRARVTRRPCAQARDGLLPHRHSRQSGNPVFLESSQGSLSR